MKRRKDLIILLLLVCAICIPGIVFMGPNSPKTRESYDIDSEAEEAKDRFYKRLPHFVDLERRVEPLDHTLGNEIFDLSALVGMPDEYSKVLVEYTQAVLAEIGAPRLIRKRFYHKHRDDTFSEYPDDANPTYDRDVVVPLLILPRPDVVRKWSASAEGQSLGWRSQDAVIKARGLFCGRTLIFEPGRLSVNPTCWPAIPLETKLPSWELFLPGYNDTFFLKLGKLTLEPMCYRKSDSENNYALQDRTASLRFGEEHGAKLLGELVTVPIFMENTRLRWASIQHGLSLRQFLAYSLLDGNGARRERIDDMLTSSRISPYVRPLFCERHQPRIKQHDMLLMPTPLNWSCVERSFTDEEKAHEEWCFDDWFPAQQDACWVIREIDESRPLQESFSLMPASESSDRPVFFTALFPETEPTQMLRDLSALYNVSADAALNSPKTMQQLNSLYEKVRAFPP